MLGLILPLVLLLRYSFNLYDPTQFMIETLSLDNYVKFFSDPYYLDVFWTTIWIAVVCTRSAWSWDSRSPTRWPAPRAGSRTS